MKTVVSLLAAFILSICPVLADEVRIITPKVDEAIQLVDSKRAGWKTRKHFYQIRGVKEYTYLTKNNTLVVSRIFDDSLPDKRSYEKRHPWQTAAGLVCTGVGMIANCVGFSTSL